MKLKLRKEISQKDCNKFKVTNEINILKFHSYEFKLPLCGIQKDDYGKYHYNPIYGDTYLRENISPTQFISFAELYKDNIVKEKNFSNGRFIVVYYLVYFAEERPTLVNDYCYFNKNRVDVEIILNENGYYRIEDIHLELNPNTSLILAIKELFSNENLSGLSFINQTDDNQYSITYYDEYGNERLYQYPSIENVFGLITSFRLIGCKEISTF